MTYVEKIQKAETSSEIFSLVLEACVELNFELYEHFSYRENAAMFEEVFGVCNEISQILYAAQKAVNTKICHKCKYLDGCFASDCPECLAEIKI